jgi:hypothetical protein
MTEVRRQRTEVVEFGMGNAEFKKGCDPGENKISSLIKIGSNPYYLINQSTIQLISY